MNDLFGISRELKILKSGVRDVFTPHKPIHSLELFRGRTTEVRSLIEHLNTPGQHALLFGDRGVGKSSLANITVDLTVESLTNLKLFKKSCDSTDNFRSILLEPLSEVGVNPRLIEYEHRKAEGGKASVGIPVFSAGVHTTSELKTTERGYIDELDSPAWVANRLAKLNGLMLVDELDAIRDASARHKLAELIKHLSDKGASFKMLLVGIAETGSDLTDGHPSVERCLRETRLTRLSDEELRQILCEGEKRVNLNFSDQAKTRIVNVSSGYPYFTHLLALKASEDAISDDRRDIELSDVEIATRRAVDDSEGRLKKQYDEACRSSGTNEYQRIICAAALLGSEEFTAPQLRQKYSDLWNKAIDQNSLNNYFNRLVSDGDSAILRRLAKGVYRFTDPRMPSFVRIYNMIIMNVKKD